jgi:hypothetical protein
MSLDESSEVIAKLADFGLSAEVDPALADIQGTWQWLPPGE